VHLLPAEQVASLDHYLASDVGGLGLKRALELGQAATIDEVDHAGLRGRGGGGFPTGRKWSTVAGLPGARRYVVVNGAEGEPGTFKDRTLMRTNPYQLVEGAMIAGFAVGAREVFIALKARFERELNAVTRAIEEMQAAGMCHDCEMTIVRGPDDYLFGEEKALLEVIEGNPALPRVLPPYEHGLFGEANPTVVNNVETISNLPHILAKGADWFRSFGTAESPGTQVCTVVGDVNTPGVREVEFGTPLRTVIDDVGGGVSGGRPVKAVFSGVANAVVTAAHLDVPLSYEGLRSIGSGMGSAGFIVYDDTACMVEVARQFSRFLYMESCGQCPPCKNGSGQVTDLLTRIEAGAGDDHDVSEMGAWLAKVTDSNRCYLAVEEQVTIGSILRAFPDEVAEHIERGGCPRPRPIAPPQDLRIAT
jgi:NADH-quinone oxidoreductase subunit F